MAKTKTDKSKGKKTSKSEGKESTKAASRAAVRARPYDSALMAGHMDDLTPSQKEAALSTYGSQDIAGRELDEGPGGDRRESPSPEKSRKDVKRAIKRGEVSGAEAENAEANAEEAENEAKAAEKAESEE